MKHITQGIETDDVDGAIRVTYVKATRTIHFFGWSHGYGLGPPESIGLPDFVRALGISKRDLRGVLRQMEAERA